VDAWFSLRASAYGFNRPFLLYFIGASKLNPAHKADNFTAVTAICEPIV
jgi:hypothetical protein